MVATRKMPAPARQASTRPYRSNATTKAAAHRKLTVTVAATRDAAAITTSRRAPLASFFQRSEIRSNMTICARLPAPGHADQKAEPQRESQRSDRPLVDQVRQRVADRRRGVLRGVRDRAGSIGGAGHHGFNVRARVSQSAPRLALRD